MTISKYDNRRTDLLLTVLEPEKNVGVLREQDTHMRGTKKAENCLIFAIFPSDSLKPVLAIDRY